MDTSPTLISRAQDFADRTAVISGGTAFSYEQLLGHSATVATALLAGADDLNEARVAFMVPPSFDYVGCQWGVWRAGGVAVPLCTAHPLPALRYVLEDTGFKLEALNTADGRIVYDDEHGEIFSEYYHKDHLGNIRLAFTDRNEDGKVELLGEGSEITQQNDFYPFGLGHEGFGLLHVDLGKNPYRYNGKEFSEELGMYDYGARWYDPAIGRWGQIDPLAEDYSSMSPYNYVANNPILFVDPDGMRIDVSGLLKNNEDGSTNYEGWSSLVRLLSDLTDITGTNVSYKDGELTMGGETGSDNFSQKGRDHLSKMISNSDVMTIGVSPYDAEGNQEATGGLAGGIQFNPSDAFGEAIATEEAVSTPGKVDNSRLTMSIGMQFMHESLHTDVGAKAAGAWIRGRRSYAHGDPLDSGSDTTPGNAVSFVNGIRGELGLLRRRNYNYSSAVPGFIYGKSGAANKFVKKSSINKKSAQMRALFKSF